MSKLAEELFTNLLKDKHINDVINMADKGFDSLSNKMRDAINKDDAKTQRDILNAGFGLINKASGIGVNVIQKTKDILPSSTKPFSDAAEAILNNVVDVTSPKENEAERVEAAAKAAANVAKEAANVAVNAANMAINIVKDAGEIVINKSSVNDIVSNAAKEAKEAMDKLVHLEQQAQKHQTVQDTDTQAPKNDAPAEEQKRSRGRPRKDNSKNKSANGPKRRGRPRKSDNK